MIDDAHPLLLGSGSPRRREILSTLGFPLIVASVDVDEARGASEGASQYVERVVADKLAALATRPEIAGAGALLVADTIVLLEGEVLGKPRDEADARAMLKKLSGRTHEVWTRFAVAAPDKPARAIEATTVVTRVVFRALADAEIDAYAATGEGADKAGAYAVQGIGSFLVREIEGSYANVVGLPACEVVLALRTAGLLGRFPFARR